MTDVSTNPPVIGPDTGPVVGLRAPLQRNDTKPLGAVDLVRKLVDRGLPEHVAEGFVLNFKDESGLNPGINERSPVVAGSRGGFGLYQLTGPRREAYEKFAADRGVEPSDVDAQLDFLVEELRTTERRAGEAIMSTTSAGEAGAVIVNEFLRPAPENRARRANKYLAQAFKPSDDTYRAYGMEPPAPEEVSAGASFVPDASLFEKYGITPPNGTSTVSPNETDAATETMLAEQDKASRIEDRGFLFDVGNFIGNTARAATLNLADPIVAALAFNRVREKNPNVTYSDVLRATNKTLSDESSTGAEVAGALFPAAGVARAGLTLGKLARNAGTRWGLLDGATRWALRHPRMAWVSRSAAIGGAAGATEEAIRESIDQTIKTAGTDNFNSEQVLDSTITGGVVGFLATPVTTAALKGAGGVFTWLKQTMGLGDAQARQAAGRILKTMMRDGNKTADEAVESIRSDIAAFRQRNGRMPALAEILPEADVEDLADTIRFYNGLSVPARKFAADIESAAIKNLEEAATAGSTLKDSSQIFHQVSRLYNNVSRRFGDTLVPVTDEAFEVFSRNRDWLAQRTNPAARAIERVIDAKENVAAVREKMRRLSNSVDLSDAQTAVATLRRDLASMMDDELNSGAVDPSTIAQLRNVIRLVDSQVKLFGRRAARGNKEFDAASTQRVLDGMETVLRDFEENGLRVRVRDVDHLRARASQQSFVASGNDAERADVLRTIADAAADVAKPVPQYAAVTRAFSRAMTRIEAQKVGGDAVKGVVSPENLRVMIRSGVTPDLKTVGKQRLNALTIGADEGARLKIRDATRGTTTEALGTAARIAGAQKVQSALQEVSPKRAASVIAAARQAVRSGRAAASLRGARSPSTAEMERRAAQETIAAGFLNKLGGAASAGLITRAFMAARIPRGTARNLVEMLGDPDRADDALRFLQRRDINVEAFFGAMAGALSDFDTKENREFREERGK